MLKLAIKLKGIFKVEQPTIRQVSPCLMKLAPSSKLNRTPPAMQQNFNDALYSNAHVHVLQTYRLALRTQPTHRKQHLLQRSRDAPRHSALPRTSASTRNVFKHSKRDARKPSNSHVGSTLLAAAVEAAVRKTRCADGATMNHGPLLAASEPARHRQHHASRLREQCRQRQQTRQLNSVQVTLDLRDATACCVRLQLQENHFESTPGTL